MIPKIIHYCWFGKNPKSELAITCINSWKKYCPDFQIIEWNEDNYNISDAPKYVQEAYANKKWAFLTDYIRLQVVYENGGVYFDTDVELIHPIDHLLEYKAYFGFEDGKNINTGLGFAAEKKCDILLDIMNDYHGISFVNQDGSFDETPCPQRNTAAFLRRGLIQNNQKQILEKQILILPSDFLCPYDYYMGKLNLTENSISIHRFAASWQSIEQKQKIEDTIKMRQRWERRDKIIHFPQRMIRKIFGDELINSIKKKK